MFYYILNNKYFIVISYRYGLLYCFIAADDDSDVSPHDFDCGDGGVSDFEYNHIGSNGLGLSTHLNIGQHSFSQMQVHIVNK